MNILLTTVGQWGYFVKYFKDALGKNGKVFAANSVKTSTFMSADGYVLTPLIYDDSYIDFLLDFCVKNNITALLSWFDMDLPVLAKNKDRFIKKNILPIISDESVIRLCNDKWETYLFLASMDLKQPKTYVDLNIVKHDVALGELSFPVILKPRWGVSSAGIYQANTIEEVDILYEKIDRLIFNSFLKYQSQGNEDASIIIQEKLKGQEHGLDIFNDLNGNYVTSIAKRKFEMQSGATSISTIVPVEPFETIAKTISTRLKFIANMDVDCFVTETGEIIILEMNCRFGGQYPFAHLAGANFPKQIIEWLIGMPTSAENISYKVGVKGYKDMDLVLRY